jgi:hypothetical protein
MIELLGSFGISAMAQNAELYRFTHRSADPFFAFFIRETFVFDGNARYMFIHTGKDNLPQSSYAHGWLFTETEDEVEAVEFCST